ncbi:MAG TPA: hypothetical protein VF151_10130 [Gemmatimonadales bacterium]
MSHDDQKELMKEAFREAAKEFMQDQMAKFGRWSLHTIAAAGVVALLYFILQMSGWHR